MGNDGIENFCNCENNDSRFEASLRTAPNQNSDQLLCPFINTVIYQNYNIDNKSQKNIRPKNKLKKKYDYEMNFEYHTSKKYEKDTNNTLKSGTKSIFNLNPKYDNNNDNFNNINNNNDINNFNYNYNNINEEEEKNNNDNNNNIEEENNNINGNNNLDYYENEIINANDSVDKNNNLNNNIIISNENKINEDSNNNIENNDNNNKEEEENNTENNSENNKEKKNTINTKIKINKEDRKQKETFSENSDNSDAPTNNIEKPKITLKNGVDIQYWNKNLYYFGNFKDNIKEGIGKMVTGVNKYCGEFKNDQANGYGVYYKNDINVIYEGLWLSDEQDKYGIEKWNDGSIFLGEYKKQNKNGIGSYVWKDGSRYEGEFKHNMFDGYGIYFYNKNKIYLGQWKNNKKHGYGEFILDDKLYVGYYNMDLREGFGLNYWKKEDKLYIGFWKNNRRSGFGKLFSEKKMKYGKWFEDKKKAEWFGDENEAKIYMEKNGLNKYQKLFEYTKDELVNYYNNFFKEDFVKICNLSEKLLK